MTPFFDGLALKFLNNSNKTMLAVTCSCINNQSRISSPFKLSKVKLFGLDILKIKQKNKVKKFYLLGFIPLLKIKTK